MTASAVLVLLVMYDVKDWLGWAHNNGSLKKLEKGRFSLLSANDNNVSFMEIAQIIEEGKVQKSAQ